MSTGLNHDENSERSIQEQTKDEIEDLERRLAEAKARLSSHTAPTQNGAEEVTERQPNGSPAGPVANPAHFLLLLADSALPLGSFAFSSGLESYLAHSRGGNQAPSSSSSSPFMPASAFTADFLPLSLSSYASATLPFVLAAHRDPETTNLAALDDAFDATIVCTVGRRASVAQGRALLSIWERSLAPALPRANLAAAEALKPFIALLKAGSSSSSAPRASSNGEAAAAAAPPSLPPVAAHLPPLFGAVANLLGLTAQQTAYVFLLGHVKALISAAVRAGLFGPYQAQRLLAGAEVQRQITAAVEREWKTPVEKAGQSVPVMDLWIGRHETLYSRIFNS